MSLTTALLAIAVSVVALLVLIVRLRVHPFIAMFGVAVTLGVVFGVPLVDRTVDGTATVGIVGVMLTSMGRSIPHILILVGLGCVIGEIIARSGGSELLGDKLLALTGQNRAVLAMVIAGLLVGSTLFFDIAVILLAPVVIAVARQAGRNAAVLAVPMAIAVLSVHAVVPPHPGAVAVAAGLGADSGLLILFGVGTMVPGALLGCWYAYRATTKLERRGLLVEPDVETPTPGGSSTGGQPATGGTGGGVATATAPATTLHLQAEAAPERVPHVLGRLVAVLLLPVLLILIATLVAAATGNAYSPVLNTIRFIGIPEVALVITTVVAFATLVARPQRRLTGMSEIGRVGLKPVGEIVLSTGGGIAFGGMIAATGTGAVLVEGLQGLNVPVVVFGFLLAVLLRASLGTTTAAVTTVATLLAGSIDTSSLGAVHVALLAVGICAGGVCLSHVNDAGFWVLSRYFTISEVTMLKTWTVGVTIMGVVCIFLVSALWYLLPMAQ